MTEYEIADLAASKAFEIQGVVALIQTAITMSTDLIQQFMSFLFAYIIAAYFIGADLSRRQMWVLTTLYVLFQTWLLASFLGRGHILGLLFENLKELQGSQGVLDNAPIVLRVTAPTLLVAALFASLYFMWCTRHPKTK
ncbi:MAG: hypothetical protein V7746_20075 [Halioglobus sp.]